MNDKIKGYADFISGQIDELSKKTLGSYVKKNVDQQTDLTYQHGSDPEEYETNPENPRKIQKRQAGLNMAVKKLTKEESKLVVNAFANFISKQVVKEGAVIKEDKENSSITSKVASHVGVPEDEADTVVSHVASHGNHHTYSTGESHWSYDGEPAHYVTHDASTGKSHDFQLPAKKLTLKQVHTAMNKAVPGGVSEEHAKAVAAEHNG